MSAIPDLWIEPREALPDDGSICWVDVQTQWTPSPWIAIFRRGKFWNYQDLEREISHVYGWRPIEKPKPPVRS